MRSIRMFLAMAGSVAAGLYGTTREMYTPRPCFSASPCDFAPPNVMPNPLGPLLTATATRPLANVPSDVSATAASGGGSEFPDGLDAAPSDSRLRLRYDVTSAGFGRNTSSMVSGKVLRCGARSFVENREMSSPAILRICSPLTTAGLVSATVPDLVPETNTP